MNSSAARTKRWPARPVRLALLCSSGGGVLEALCQVHQGGKWPYEIAGVITDRVCGAEAVAANYGVTCERIEPTSAHDWSAGAAKTLRRWSSDAVLLLIMRKVGPAIWRDLDIPVWNLHPSLLPAYRGADALERNHADALVAAKHGDSIRLGATIHAVTDEIDAGPIISQRYFTIEDAPMIEQAQHICFLYKVALVLECVCKLIDGTLPTWRDESDSTLWHERYELWEPYEPITDVLTRLAQPWAADWMRQQVIKGAARTAAKVLRL